MPIKYNKQKLKPSTYLICMNEIYQCCVIEKLNCFRHYLAYLLDGCGIAKQKITLAPARTHYL